ncbi:GNAT family N-acetyltransferase [Pseudoalteromonas sp. S16_S37]|uniref:GNAT family N-acetyltransferase n=1 Tax=Pseudoalteromonas sp. S16_S37 TaxID=2720228 RepID=UPI0016815961|nr:GNAT family N-acetyltransferase [Pseudoalteromonas sp. S16_S37]MBD1582648.1 GNAT family N-acetyltransferase [Pseudoalteromonas sp. S16_S37]
MQLFTPRLLLKPITYRDMVKLHALLNDPLISKYNDYGESVSQSEIRELIQWDLEQSYLGLGVRLSINCQTSGMIGCIGLYEYNLEMGEVYLGFELSPLHWGQGIMREAVECVTTNIAKLININSDIKLLARVEEDNLRSIKLLQQQGFIKLENSEYSKLVTI